MSNIIKEFQGEYRWLSNFYFCRIVLDGVEYPSVEHAFMSAKSDDENWKEFCSDPRNSPSIVKKEGKKVKLIENWDNIKFNIMKECLIQKFNQEPFKSNFLICPTNLRQFASYGQAGKSHQ